MWHFGGTKLENDEGIILLQKAAILWQRKPWVALRKHPASCKNVACFINLQQL